MVQFYKPKKQVKNGNTQTVNNLLVDRLSDDGRGIAVLPSSNISSSIAGKTVFIEGALPSEEVSIKVFKHSFRYAEALTLNVHNESRHRVTPRCKVYSNCGGCQVQHMSLELQHQFKHQAILNQLKKWAGIEPQVFLPIITAEAYQYRRRIRLGVTNSVSGKQAKTIGFRQKNSKQLININTCPVVSNQLDVLIKPLHAWLNRNPNHVTHIELIDSSDGIGIVIRHERKLAVAVRMDLEKELASFDVLCWFQGGKGRRLEGVNGEQVEPYLSYQLVIKALQKPINLLFHPQDFIQSNAEINRLMVEQALALLEPSSEERILDLFCGVGNFTLALAHYAKEVVGIEGVDAMVNTANLNAQRNKIENARFLQADLFNIKEIETEAVFSGQYDGVILDPPRSGARVICENIDKLMPKRIVYISCDSATFARDAQILCAKGYTLSQFGLIDMFAQTFHNEMMGLFIHPSLQ